MKKTVAGTFSVFFFFLKMKHELELMSHFMHFNKKIFSFFVPALPLWLKRCAVSGSVAL